MSNYIEDRPWGTFEILLDDKSCKVKKITVKPDENLSYQFHYKRSEHWIIVGGTGEVCLNDKSFNIQAGERIHIPTMSRHSIKNIGDIDLVFIEIQTGEYFGEDDIVRLEDKYGRIQESQ